MRKVSIYVFLFFVLRLSAQFDAQQSQYMFHNESFNPAAVGNGQLINVTGQYRLNWVGFPGAGSTALFSINSPIKIGDSKHGIGISFMDDKIGGFTNQTFHLQYAYKKNLFDGVMSVGADLGFESVGFIADSVRDVTLGDYYQFASDPAIPTSDVSGLALDMGLGVWYSTSSWYSGISYEHLNRPVIDWNDTNEFTQYGLMYLTGGLSKPLADSKIVLKPSFLFKTDFTTWSCDLSGRLVFDDKYWGGLSYRVLDAVVLFAGINLASGLSLGYSVDVSTNKLITSNYGSHELILRYSFEYVFAKSTTKYKSIRFL